MKVWYSFDQKILMSLPYIRVDNIFHFFSLTAVLSYWKPRVAIIPILSSLVAPDVVVMAKYGAIIDDKVDIMTPLTLGFQWLGCGIIY